jgi:hypothetical protein
VGGTSVAVAAGRGVKVGRGGRVARRVAVGSAWEIKGTLPNPQAMSANNMAAENNTLITMRRVIIRGKLLRNIQAT